MKSLSLLTLLVACTVPVEPTPIEYKPPPELISDSPAPSVEFTFTCDTNRVCLFDASKSKPDKYTIKMYGWAFGDASIYISKLPSVEHKYDKSGEYRVELIVEDTNNMNGRLYRTIEVK